MSPRFPVVPPAQIPMSSSSSNDPSSQHPRLVSFRQAAALTGVSERTLTRLVERGELSVYRFGHTKRLDVQELLTPASRGRSARAAD